MNNVLKLFAVLLFFTCGVAQAQLLLMNGGFEGDLAGWELPSTPDTTTTWQLDGNPAGSLRIESSWSGPPPAVPINIIDVRSACFEIAEGNYLVEADVRSELGFASDECHLDVILYDELDCSGGETSRAQTIAMEQGTWERVGGPLFLAPGARVAFRVSLSLWKHPSAATTTCSFDNVVLRGPDPFPHEIPVLGPTALVFLALGLAIAALVVLQASPPATR